MSNKNPDTMYYPACCTSGFCGKCIGYGCTDQCRHWPKLKAFTEWKEQNNAYRPNPIWSPSYWRKGPAPKEDLQQLRTLGEEV